MVRKTVLFSLLMGLLLVGFVMADATASPTATPTVVASATPTISATLSATASPTPSVVVTASVSATASPSASATAAASVTPAPVDTTVPVASGSSTVSIPASSKPGAWWMAPNAEIWTCRGNYDIAVAQNLMSAYPAASDLSATVTSLQTAESTLPPAVAAGDGKAYSQTVRDFDHSWKDARVAINKDWHTFVNDKTVTQAQIDALKAQVKQDRVNQDACLFAAVKDYDLAKIAYWNLVFQRHSDYVANLTAKGIITDGSALTTLISSAQSQVIAPFTAAINAATNRSQLWAAEQQYCLDDGCKKGLDFHYSANFDLQVDTAIVNALSANVSADANLTSDADVQAKLSAAKADLADATSLLSSIGTAYYQPGQWQSVSGKLRNVSKDIAQLRRAIAKAKRAMRQEEQKQRQEQANDQRQAAKARQKQGNQGIA